MSANGPPKLLNIIMKDGSRHFLDAPADMDMAGCLDCLTGLRGARIMDVLPSHLGSWLHFTVEGYVFSANDPYGEVWLFAEDATTPERVLRKIAAHLYKR